MQVVEGMHPLSGISTSSPSSLALSNSKTLLSGTGDARASHGFGSSIDLNDMRDADQRNVVVKSQDGASPLFVKQEILSAAEDPDALGQIDDGLEADPAVADRGAAPPFV